MTLHALSPLDGRYENETAPLRDYFSEFAYLRSRARLELDFLSALSETGLVRPLTDSERATLDSFSDDDARRIQEYEKTTKHDVKAIEYFLRDKLTECHSEPQSGEESPTTEQGTLGRVYHDQSRSAQSDIIPWIHFGLTSEDMNNIAQAIALRDSRDVVILPAFDNLITSLRDFAQKYRALPMLARTQDRKSVV